MKQTVAFHLGLDRFGITRQRVRAAMRRFDKDLRGKESETGAGYVVMDRKRPYPPKKLLALTIGRTSTQGFSGGKQTNDIFKKLNFDVPPISEVTEQLAAQESAALRRPVPQVKDVLRFLLNQHWRILSRSALRDRGLRWPGVYLLACGGKNLNGKVVSTADISYIGMSSRASLAARLRQFLDSVEGRSGHSAGERLATDPSWRYAVSKAKAQGGDGFYFAPVTIPCVTRKGRRSNKDLQRMGVIAAVEQFALARVLQERHEEPPLNMQ